MKDLLANVAGDLDVALQLAHAHSAHAVRIHQCLLPESIGR
jgi:hypothetical protein